MRFQICSYLIHQRSIADDFKWNHFQGLPRPKKRPQALLWREPSNKKCVESFPITYAGVGMDEVRLHNDLLRRKPAFDQLFSGKLSQGNVNIHLLLPGSKPAVDSKHSSNDTGFSTAFTITGMYNAWPRRLTQAIFADMSIAVEDRCRTDQAVIVERLHHWHACFPTGVIR